MLGTPRRAEPVAPFRTEDAREKPVEVSSPAFRSFSRAEQRSPSDSSFQAANHDPSLLNPCTEPLRGTRLKA
jgi:hypothetical protein